MKRLQAFKFSLRLTGVNTRQLYRAAGSCRFVYNKALALQKKRYEAGEKKLTYAGLCKELTIWRNQPELNWLKASPSQTLQQALKDLDRAYQNFFSKRASFPQFKRRGVRDTCRFPQGIKLDQTNDRVYLPKLGWVRYRNSRMVEGEIKNVTISRSGDKWYISIQTERDVKEIPHAEKTAIGIDVGIARLVTTSDGTVFPAINSFKLYQTRLANYQRAVNRKKKFSSNWKKAIRKVNRLHQKIKYIRQNYLHQTSHVISKNHAMICLEDLQIKNMSKQASGNKVKAKSGLNRAILDQGWYELRRQLEYKQQWRGGMVMTVSPKNTSRTCPHCDFISAENRKTQAQFMCVQCGYKNHADVVGAMNILRAGHAQLACGEIARLGCSMKQEPTEVIQDKVA